MWEREKILNEWIERLVACFLTRQGFSSLFLASALRSIAEVKIEITIPYATFFLKFSTVIFTFFNNRKNLRPELDQDLSLMMNVDPKTVKYPTFPKSLVQPKIIIGQKQAHPAYFDQLFYNVFWIRDIEDGFLDP